MCKNVKLSSVALVLCLLVFNHQTVLSNSIVKNDIRKGNSPVSLGNLSLVIDEVKKHYYKPLDNEFLLNQAVSGMLFSLDPHSSYLNSEDLKELEMETVGKFGGIGVEVVPDHGAIRVIAPIEDSPAYKAGVRSNDYIIQIDNQLVHDMTVRHAITMMRGKKGTDLSLTIIRKNVSKPIIFKLRREIIKAPTIKERILESSYGYIRIAYFQEQTESDLVEAIKKMQKRLKSVGGIKGLVLDLRNNPGGLLVSAIKVANNFLDASSLKDDGLIVYTKGQSKESRVSAKATVGDIIRGIPIVVLINGGSASASEVVAGALQDHKRAIIAGTTSFGKGSVQTLIPLDKNRISLGAIKLTTALYYTPNGRSIQAKGINPDIVVEDMQFTRSSNRDMPKFNEMALVGHIESDDKDGRQQVLSTNVELAYTDYQLYEALNILKSQNVIKQDE
ncbi:MAG: S41 family peptidase [Coxiellaceae bacterium]|jgi:carboxyl-terminal processing protease|nr:S41 family peptidase [Coxiellaceae bacterium]